MEELQMTKKQRKAMHREAKLAAAGARERKETVGRIVLWGVVLLIVGGIIFAMIKYGARTAPVTNGTLADPVTSADWVRGNSNASTTLVEYSDFQCPYCAVVEPTLNNILRQYGDKVRLVYRHYPLPSHNHSTEAARAAEAAGKQGKFWEMHDQLFNSQGSWSKLSSVDDAFVEYAVKLGLNKEMFEKDYDSSEIINRVNEQRNSGDRSSVGGTPTFFLNGTRLELTNLSDIETAVAAAVRQ